ncbi:branched-chain amino acid ABC transporter permease [Corticibacterium sp. UT-5YL-CI-8]|nr:branched-chain amino acid ABC transporter permease [Tianweitania sp. UT-5YL-CI-8]
MLFILINSLTMAMAVFLVAAGLTLIYGIMRILNFAHGAFFMIGAYLTSTMVGQAAGSVLMLVAAALAAAVLVGILGLAVQRLVLRRVMNADEHYMLIATFAVMLICVGSVKLIWGLDFFSVDPPPALSGGVLLGTVFVPSFSLFVIASGVLVFILLDLLLQRSWSGKMLTAVARDGWMAELMGLNTSAWIMLAIGGSFALAGLAGGLLLPNQTLTPVLGDSFLLLAFVTIVMGGLGSVRGAFIAALVLGLIDGLNMIVMPQFPGVAIYVGMIAFLLLNPNGFLGEGRL